MVGNLRRTFIMALSKKAIGCLGCGGGVGLVLIIIAIGASTQISSSSTTQSNIENISNPINLLKSESDVVTLEEYNRIQHGMTYEQVVEIIGDPGVEQASGEMPAIPGVSEPVITKMYMWMNSGMGGNMNATFQDNKLINKAQALLK